ncbi:MAG: BrnT family toxin [Tepidisphaerales bacterium]
MEFRWNEWNLEHATCHGVSPDEVEYVVEHARPPFPEEIGAEKFRVRGRTAEGRYVQVVYIFDPEDVVYVIHARDLTEREKRALRRRLR